MKCRSDELEVSSPVSGPWRCRIEAGALHYWKAT